MRKPFLGAPRLTLEKYNKLFWTTLLAVPVLLIGCAKKDPPPAFGRPPSPVVVATASSQTVPLYLDEVGRTVAREVVQVQPQVSGTITEIKFTDGANLKKGDPLFTIDP